MIEFKNILVFLIVVLLFVVEGLFEVTILSLPGALIRWLFDGRKKELKQYYKEKAKLNTILGVLVLAVLLLIAILLIRAFAR
jgi:hypothetical protein